MLFGDMEHWDGVERPLRDAVAMRTRDAGAQAPCADGPAPRALRAAGRAEEARTALPGARASDPGELTRLARRRYHTAPQVH
jgi:hypothetical protein